MNSEVAAAMPAEQAPTPSVEERVGAAFGKMMGWEKKATPPPKQEPKSEPRAEAPTNELSEQSPDATPEDGGDTTAPAADETFEFEFEGQTIALPKHFERAVQNMKDYTQKTQSVSEQRKTAEHTMQRMQVDAMRSQFEASNAKELQQLAALDSVLENVAQSVNWAAMSTDEIVRQKIQIDQYKEQREAIARSLSGKFQQFQAQHEKAMGDLRTKASELTAQRIPGWSEATAKAVRDHALNDGYTESELNQAQLDPRHNVTLWKAQQYDLLKAKAAKTVTDVKSVKTTPSNPMPQNVKDKLAFNKQYKSAQTQHERNKLVEARAGALFSKR